MLIYFFRKVILYSSSSLSKLVRETKLSCLELTIIYSGELVFFFQQSKFFLCQRFPARSEGPKTIELFLFSLSFE